MKLLILVILLQGLVIAHEASNKAAQNVIEAPNNLTFGELESLDNIFQFENVDENIEHFAQELDVNFLKRLETGSGFTDDQDTFKLIPCATYFSLFKKLNGRYKYLGKILYPNKFNTPSSIYIAKHGEAFVGVFSRFEKKIEEYEYMLFVWLKQRENCYKRFNLGYINAAAISNDGSTIVGFNTELNKSYYWKLKNGEFELSNYVSISNRSNKPMIGINEDGSRYFILDQELIAQKRNKPVDDYFLELDLFETKDDGFSSSQVGRYLLPASRAVGDLNAKGDMMVLYFKPTYKKFRRGENQNCYGDKCENARTNPGKLLIINFKDFVKNPDLLYYAHISQAPDRLKIKSDINALLLGFVDYYDLYQFKLPKLQKIVPEVKEKINCTELLASLDNQILD